MAPALTANSFLLTTSPHSRLVSLHKPRRIIVCAKKSAGDVESESSSSNSNPFRFNFDFAKVSDVKSLIPVVTGSSGSGTVFGKRKDPNTVFVAGATGQAGIRIAQTLLREGFSVRAGVPELGAAQDLARLAVSYKVISTEESKRLNAVESTFQDPEAIAKAIGNATKAVVTIGPCENGPTAEVTTSEALQLIQGAQLAGVSHVTIIYDTSPPSFATTNNVLDGIQLFFNNIFSKSQPLTLKEFIDGLVATDLKYTLIKTQLIDDSASPSSNNFIVTAEGAAVENDYKVTKSQIASLVADVFSNTEVAENKVVELSTSPEAAARPVSELFSVIPVDGRREAYIEAVAKAEAEEAVKAAETGEVKKPGPTDDFQEQAQLAQKSITNLMARLKTATSKNTEKPESEPEPEPTTEDGPGPDSALSWRKLGSGFASAVKNKNISPEPKPKPKPTTEDGPGPDGSPGLALSWRQLGSSFASAVKNNSIELPKVQIATVRGQAKARTLTPKPAVVKKPTAAKRGPPPVPQPKPKESKAEVRKIFGGVFQQETIYVDD